MERYEHGGNHQEDIRLDFSVNTHPLGLPQEVRQALLDVEDFSRYPDPACTSLRQALAEHHGLQPGNVLCGNGASDLILRICACLRPQKALVTAPTFSEYERSVTLFGGQVEEYTLQAEQGFLLDEGFLNVLSPNVDIVFLCSPNNPTGRLIPWDLLAEISCRCRDNGTVLVVDECFLDFTQGRTILPLLAECPQLLILKAFTKFYAMAGLRLGYLLGRETLLNQIKPFGPEWSVSLPAQRAGLAALTAQPQWGKHTQEWAKNQRDHMTLALTDLGLTIFPSDANFLLLRSQHPLHHTLKESGILVRNCANFTGLDDHYIRIGLKTRDENRQLLAAIKEVLYGKINHDPGNHVQRR